jgi:hypothetical protein
MVIIQWTQGFVSGELWKNSYQIKEGRDFVNVQITNQKGNIQQEVV